MKIKDIKVGDYAQSEGRYDSWRRYVSRVRVVDVGPFVTTQPKYSHRADWDVEQTIDGEAVKLPFKRRDDQHGPAPTKPTLYVAIRRYNSQTGELGEVRFVPVTQIHATWEDHVQRLKEQRDAAAQATRERQELEDRRAATLERVIAAAKDAGVTISPEGYSADVSRLSYMHTGQAPVYAVSPAVLESLLGHAATTGWVAPTETKEV